MYKATLKFLASSAFARCFARILYRDGSEDLHREVMSLDFRGPVGFAAGIDKDGRYPKALSSIGASFEIIGPVFYSQKGGIKSVVSNLRNLKSKLRIGVNITKQPGSTTEDQILRDYLEAFAYSYDFVDFSVLNFTDESIGSVRELAFIQGVTDPILDTRISYDSFHPVLLKISSSMTDSELGPVLDYCLMNGVDGIVAGTLDQISAINAFTKGRFPVIAAAAVSTPSEALALLDAGASLIALDNPLKSLRMGLPKAIVRSVRNRK